MIVHCNGIKFEKKIHTGTWQTHKCDMQASAYSQELRGSKDYIPKKIKKMYFNHSKDLFFVLQHLMLCTYVLHIHDNTSYINK